MSETMLPKVFFVVTIPTHLRVMMDAAKMTQSSGKYQSHVLYYPSAVFDQNHENCAQSEFPAFIWTGTQFLPKAEYLGYKLPASQKQSAVAKNENDSQEQTKHSSIESSIPPALLARLLEKLPHRGIYRQLIHRFPFLPSPSMLLGGVHRIWAILRSCVFFAKKTVTWLVRTCNNLYWLLHIRLLFLSDYLLSLPQGSNEKKLQQNSRLRKLLLSAFSKEWNEQLQQKQRREIIQSFKLTSALDDSLVSEIHTQKIFYNSFSALLAKESPALIVLPEENFFYLSHLMVHAAHQKKISSIVVPFTVANSLEWAESVFNIESYQATEGANKILTRAFPNWVLMHRGHQLILPSVFILACEYLDITPDQPWVINSGSADAIASESQFMCNYYRNAGIRASKIHFTGTVADDKIYFLLNSRDKQRRELAERSGIDIKGKVVLIGLPPNPFGGGKRKGCEFDSYDEVIQFMVGKIVEYCDQKNTVLINLHPRIRREDVMYLESFGATVIHEPIEQLVPLADIYVAVVSATIRLAISCGIPVVNYDLFCYDYDDYKNLPGICEMNSKIDFLNTINSLLHDDKFFSRIQAAQKDTANQLSAIDGQAGTRILGLFDELCRSRSA